MHKLITNSCFSPLPSWQNDSLLHILRTGNESFKHNQTAETKMQHYKAQQIGDSLKAEWYFSAFGNVKYRGW